MRRMRINTSRGTPPAAGPIMLGLWWLLLAAGCGASGQASFFVPATTARSPEPRPEPPPTSRVERPARQEPTDPGADTLVRSIRDALGPAAMRSGAELRINMEGLRNQSHASAAEFVGLRLRLAELLTRSGQAETGARAIRFIVAAADTVDFELTGTAYMAETGGVDQWELYLSVQPAGRSWAIWEAQGVRMPRRPRPGEPQITLR